MTADLLVELGCEELPQGACAVADANAAGVAREWLERQRLLGGDVAAYVSPRRIAVLAADVPPEQPPERVEHRGPPENVARDGNGWTKAAEGFARRHGVAADALELRDGFVWVVGDAAQASLDELAQGLVDALVDGLQIPKNMRWGRESLRFARPIRTLAVLHGERVLPAVVAGVESGRTVRGHRFVRPELELARASDYVDALEGAAVVVPTAQRAEIIRASLAAAAEELGAAWSDPGGVLREVVYLVERPRALAGSIRPEHMRLPDAVLVTAMQSHQRYLPLTAADGSRFAGFLTIVNSDATLDATVRAGNERVLAGRLDDAAFSLEQDLARGLEDMAGALDRITYHVRAGSLADRTARIRALVDALLDAAGVDGPDAAHAREAARLAKADQASVMVAQFAELEGGVGAEYARRAGLPAPVAQAIGEQFLPDGAGAPPPPSVPGALLALADKLDALVTGFAIGERPTGSRDPYALRRAAAGVVEIVRDRGWPLDLAARIRQVHALLVDQGADLASDADETASLVTPFVLDRVDAVLQADGVPVDVVRAARGADPNDPLAHERRARALAAALDSDDFARAHTAFTRAHRLAERAGEAAAELDRAAFEDPTEAGLADAIAEVREPLARAVAASDFRAALHEAARLGPPVDAFFDAVLVMHDDPRVRANRLRLLVDATELLRSLGDLAHISR